MRGIFSPVFLVGLVVVEYRPGNSHEVLMQVLLIVAAVLIFFGVVSVLTKGLDWRLQERWFKSMGVATKKPVDWDKKRNKGALLFISIGLVLLLINFLSR